MMIASTPILGLLGLLGAAIAGGHSDGPSESVTWDDETYTATSTGSSSASSRKWLPQSNEYMGLGQSSLGPFFEASRPDDDGIRPRHTFATITGFWHDAEGRDDSSTAGIPHFTDLLVQACGSTLNGSVDTAEISDSKTTLSFLDGVATWAYRWTPPGCADRDGTTGAVVLDIAYEAFLSLDDKQLAAVRLSVGLSQNGGGGGSSDGPDAVDVGFVDMLDGRSADRTTNFQSRFFPGPKRGILAGVSPEGRGETTTAAYVYSTVSSPDFPPFAKAMSSDPDTSSVSQTYTVQLGPGVERLTTTVVKYVGVAATEHFENAPNVAMQTAIRASKAGWDAIRLAHGATHKKTDNLGSEAGTGHDEL